ncbi:MAG: Inner spore coat protein [Bacillales bacterium]|nr:Inner spore coat protein [Bacillales bacterium]
MFGQRNQQLGCGCGPTQVSPLVNNKLSPLGTGVTPTTGLSPMGMGPMPSQVSPMGMGPMPSQVSPMGMGPMPSQVSPMGMGPMPSQVSPMGMGPVPSQVSPLGTGLGGVPAGYPTQVSPFGGPVGPVAPVGPVPTQVAPTVYEPTTVNTVNNYQKTIVPVVHPAHTQVINNKLIEYQHHYPQTCSVCNQVSCVHKICGR